MYDFNDHFHNDFYDFLDDFSTSFLTNFLRVFRTSFWTNQKKLMLCATFDVTHISRGHNDAMRSVLDTVQDFLTKLGIKPRMHLLRDHSNIT